MRMLVAGGSLAVGLVVGVLVADEPTPSVLVPVSVSPFDRLDEDADWMPVSLESDYLERWVDAGCPDCFRDFGPTAVVGNASTKLWYLPHEVTTSPNPLGADDIRRAPSMQWGLLESPLIRTFDVRAEDDASAEDIGSAIRAVLDYGLQVDVVLPMKVHTVHLAGPPPDDTPCIDGHIFEPVSVCGDELRVVLNSRAGCAVAKVLARTPIRRVRIIAFDEAYFGGSEHDLLFVLYAASKYDVPVVWDAEEGAPLWSKNAPWWPDEMKVKS